MNKTDKTLMITDTIWLAVMMIGIILAGHRDSVQEYMHYISLVIWYIGARYLSSTWKI